MATMTIRNLPDHVRQALRMRAAAAGRSMEAEVRAILTQACAPAEASSFDPSSLQAFVSEQYSGDVPTGVVDALIAERRAEAARE